MFPKRTVSPIYSTAPTTIPTSAPCGEGWPSRTAKGFTRFIHDITNTQFRSKFEDDLGATERAHRDRGHQRLRRPAAPDQLPPGAYAIVTVGKVDNLDALVEAALAKNGVHFSEMTGE